MLLDVSLEFSCIEVVIERLPFVDVAEDELEVLEVYFDGGYVVACEYDFRRYVLTHHLSVILIIGADHLLWTNTTFLS